MNATARTLQKSLTKILSVTRDLANAAEYDALNGRFSSKNLNSPQSRQKAKLTRNLRTAWNHAMKINDSRVNAMLVAVENLTKEVVWHTKYSHFFNTDIDAREWAGWSIIAELRVKINDMRDALRAM